MFDIEFAEDRARREVDRLFKADAHRQGQGCEWPVLGGGYIRGLDRTKKMRDLAVRALVARDWFSENGPPDAPELPLSDRYIPELKYTTPIRHMTSYFASSLSRNDWDFKNHPSFEDFARGVLASPEAPDFLKNNKEFCKRYPPRPLPGLEMGFVWRPARPTKRRKGHGVAH